VGDIVLLQAAGCPAFLTSKQLSFATCLAGWLAVLGLLVEVFADFSNGSFCFERVLKVWFFLKMFISRAKTGTNHENQQLTRAKTSTNHENCCKA
jgi:hypothetical protein